MKRYFWIAVAAFSGIYIFIPEFTDIVPIIGWLDEAAAFALMNYALKQANIEFKWSKLFNIFNKNKTIQVDPK